MSNHVIYDRIWVSKKLSRCSRAAALAYPWIYLVADDHGRFELLPRVIWAQVFGAREDVKPSEVVAWLGEYEREGLLEVYEAGGKRVGSWGGFSGPPPSKRRPSLLPDRNGVVDTEGISARSRFHAAASSLQAGSEVPSQELEREQEQETGTGNRNANGKPEAPARPRGKPLSPAELEEFGIGGEVGEAEALRVEIGKLLAEEAEARGRGQDVLLAKASKTGDGRVIVNLAGVASVPWLRVTRDRLLEMRLSRSADQPDRPPPEPRSSPEVERVVRDAPKLVDEFVEWRRANPQPAHLGTAFKVWREGRGISFEACASASLLRLADEALKVRA